MYICILLLLTHVSNNDGKINLKHPIFSFLHDVLNFSKKNNQETKVNTQNNKVIMPNNQQHNSNKNNRRKAPVKKEVSFNLDLNSMDYSSDSDSDIGTDIDFEAFKNSL